jgi:hypothetical protein
MASGCRLWWRTQGFLPGKLNCQECSWLSHLSLCPRLVHIVSVGTFLVSTMTTFEPGKQPEAQQPRQTWQGRVGVEHDGLYGKGWKRSYGKLESTFFLLRLWGKSKYTKITMHLKEALSAEHRGSLSWGLSRWRSVSEGLKNHEAVKNSQTSRAAVTHAFNPSTREAEAGGFLSSRPVWSTKWVPGQPGLYRETLSRKTKTKQNKIPKPSRAGDGQTAQWVSFSMLFTLFPEQGLISLLSPPCAWYPAGCSNCWVQALCAKSTSPGMMPWDSVWCLETQCNGADRAPGRPWRYGKWHSAAGYKSGCVDPFTTCSAKGTEDLAGEYKRFNSIKDDMASPGQKGQESQAFACMLIQGRVGVLCDREGTSQVRMGAVAVRFISLW